MPLYLYSEVGVSLCLLGGRWLARRQGSSRGVSDQGGAGSKPHPVAARFHISSRVRG